MSGVYISGYTGMLAHSWLFFLNEKKNTLGMITELKAMARKLKNPRKDELDDFAYFLRLMTMVKVGVWIFATAPMVGLRIYGLIFCACMYDTYYFILAYIPILILFIPAQNFCGHIYTHVHLTIAQSRMYFTLRLNRVTDSLRNVIVKLRRPASKKRCEEWFTVILERSWRPS
jgi:hypothetical protein